MKLKKAMSARTTTSTMIAMASLFAFLPLWKSALIPGSTTSTTTHTLYPAHRQQQQQQQMNMKTAMSARSTTTTMIAMATPLRACPATSMHSFPA